jgi:hypothetical protein
MGVVISLFATPVFGGSYFGYYDSRRDGPDLMRGGLYGSIIGFVFGIPFTIGMVLLFLELPSSLGGLNDPKWLVRLPRTVATALVYFAALGGFGGVIGSSYAKVTRY